MKILFADSSNIDKNNVKYGFLSKGSLLENFRDARVTLRVWLEEIAKDNNRKIDVEFFEDEDKIFKRFKEDKKLEMIVVSLPFFYKNYEEISLIASDFWSLSFDKNKFSQYYLVASKDIDFKDISDLKGKSVGFKEYFDINNIWLDKYTLDNLGKSYKKLVSKENYYKSDSSALLKVFF